MMKATTWFGPLLLTLLCATRLVCTAQRGHAGGAPAIGNYYVNGYPLDYLDAQAIQDDYLLVKRNKPSLSIVNPLDVLRQRLLLEIARRQMKENTRQVELNRAILKNVGKRRSQQQLDSASLLEQHFPSQMWSSSVSASPYASSRFFDFVQQPQQQQQQPLAQAQAHEAANDAKKSLNVNLAKHLVVNGYEIANETNHENGNRKPLLPRLEDVNANNDAENGDDNDDDADDTDEEDHFQGNDNDDVDERNVVNTDNANERYPWHYRYFYRLHKNKHYAN